MSGKSKRPGPIYRDLAVIGEGSFGLVCSAWDEETAERVAIKRLKGLLSCNDKTDMKQALRELNIMRCLGVHKNVVTLRDAFVGEDKSDLYLVMDLMESDLMRIISSSQPLTEAHHRHFTKQLLEGVAFLHSHRVIHRDIKPSNLLVNRNCDLKIGDFGLARICPQDMGQPLSGHVVTRFYRAPELMLTPDSPYDMAVDMWAVGCVIGELLRRKPLFPGRSFIHQLVVIMEVLGKPSGEELHHMNSYELRRFLATRPGDKKGKGIKSLIPEVLATTESLSLLHGLLVYNPEYRLTAEEALEHVYLGGSLTATTDIQPLACLPLNLSYECPKLSIRELRAQVMKEVVEARKIKEKKLGIEPLSTQGYMVKSPREASRGQGEEADKQVPSWPTVTATDSLSWGEEAWADVDELRQAKMAQEQPLQEKRGFWRWLSRVVGFGSGDGDKQKPSLGEEEKEDKEDQVRGGEKEGYSHVPSSLLMAHGGKGGAALGVGLLVEMKESPPFVI